MGLTILPRIVDLLRDGRSGRSGEVEPDDLQVDGARRGVPAVLGGHDGGAAVGGLVGTGRAGLWGRGGRGASGRRGGGHRWHLGAAQIGCTGLRIGIPLSEQLLDSRVS